MIKTKENSGTAENEGENADEPFNPRRKIVDFKLPTQTMRFNAELVFGYDRYVALYPGDTVQVSRTGRKELEPGWRIAEKLTVRVVEDTDGERFAIQEFQWDDIRESGCEHVGWYPGFIVTKGDLTKTFTEQELLKMNPRPKNRK